ncbi:hypothetical protein PAXRUDRAFT_834013, partial [Paxillus rubicundulus Ve08.2h10]
MPWDTEGKITSKEMRFLKSRRASIVTDIHSLRAVIGLVESQKRWGIVNRVPETVVTSLAEEMLMMMVLVMTTCYNP